MLACSLWLPENHSLAGLAPAEDLPQTAAWEERDNLNSHHLSDFFCIKKLCLRYKLSTFYILSFVLMYSYQRHFCL